MKPVAGQTFQWSFANTLNKGDNQVTTVSPITSSSPSSPLTKSTASPISSTASTANHYKPYASSTLWNPALHNNVENPTETFLTLTPVSKKPLTSSLPFISLTPTKPEMKHQDKETPLINNDDKTRSERIHPKPFEHNSIVLVPTVGLRIKPPFPNQSKTKKNDESVNNRAGLFQLRMLKESKRRFKQQSQQDRHRQQQEKPTQEDTERDKPTSVPKLPLIFPSHRPGPRLPKFIEQNRTLNKNHDFNSRSRITFENENKVLDRRTEDSKKQDESKMWNNLPTTKKNSFLVSVSDSNLQDERTLYSNKQLAFYSRITRENSTMPPPIDYSRRLPNAVLDGNYVEEKRYVKDNYPQTKTDINQFPNDQASPGIYRTLLKRKQARFHYMRSLGQEDEKGFQNMHLTCPRCNQKVLVDDAGNEIPQLTKVIDKSDDSDENNNHDNYTQSSSLNRNGNINKQNSHPRGLERFAKVRLGQHNEYYYNESIDKHEGIKYNCIARDNLTDSTGGDRGQPMVPTGYTTGNSRGHGKSQFCDVLGRRTCRKCREFFVKHFRMKVEDSAPKRKPVQPPSPPTTPGDSYIPTQALHKIVIRVKDKQGVMAVAVGVNEDAAVG